VTTCFAAVTGPNNLSTYCTKQTLQHHKAKPNALNSKYPACNLQVATMTTTTKAEFQCKSNASGVATKHPVKEQTVEK
jgi:hypothetical protein